MCRILSEIRHNKWRSFTQLVIQPTHSHVRPDLVSHPDTPRPRRGSMAALQLTTWVVLAALLLCATAGTYVRKIDQQSTQLAAAGGPPRRSAVSAVCRYHLRQHSKDCLQGRPSRLTVNNMLYSKCLTSWRRMLGLCMYGRRQSHLCLPIVKAS